MNSADTCQPMITPAYRAGSGSPLVLLHGLTGSWRIWRPVLSSLCARHDVFVPTLGGHHGGPVLQAPVSIRALADALENTLDAAGIQSAHLAGNSLGGWLALELARRGRARSVVAISPAGAWRSQRDLLRLTAIFLSMAKLTPRVLPHAGWAIRRPRSRRLLLWQVMEHGDRIPAAEAVQLFEDFAECTIIEELIATIRSNGGFDGGPLSTGAPIRLAWGERDRTLPFGRYGRPFAARIQGAEIAMLRGVGHVPMYDDPALVADTIIEVTSAVDATYDAAATLRTRGRHDKMTSTLEGTHGSIHVHEWPAEDPRFVALIAHGYGEHAGRYGHVAARLVADGAVVYAPDHYGHGRSDGPRAIITDVEDLVADLQTVAVWACARHPGLPLVLIGHSLGGLIATRFAQEHGEELAALVLSGPIIGGNPDVEALLGLDPLPEVPLDPSLLSRDPEVGEAYAADELVYHGPFVRQTLEAIFAAGRAVASGPELAVPALWLHGELDGLAPLDATRPVAERIAGPIFEQKVYDGARHEIFNETNRDEVIDEAISFLNRQLAVAESA
jgi:alpha-beta hydrolase superfamily lysophospholipase